MAAVATRRGSHLVSGHRPRGPWSAARVVASCATGPRGGRWRHSRGRHAPSHARTSSDQTNGGNRRRVWAAPRGAKDRVASTRADRRGGVPDTRTRGLRCSIGADPSLTGSFFSRTERIEKDRALPPPCNAVRGNEDAAMTTSSSMIDEDEVASGGAYPWRDHVPQGSRFLVGRVNRSMQHEDRHQQVPAHAHVRT